MDTYIGLDAHASSRYWGSHVVETNAKALIEVLRSIPGSLGICAWRGPAPAPLPAELAERPIPLIEPRPLSCHCSSGL